jgi:ribose-phosphate pyrophosphokinase
MAGTIKPDTPFGAGPTRQEHPAHMRDIAIFSGTAHPGLANEICEQLGKPLLHAEFSRFSNDCLQVQLQANCREQDVFLIQPLSPPVQEHLMELLLMADAARGASAARITVVIPHYAYARSDKKDAPRISIAGRLVADLLVTAGADRVLTMALHAPQVHGFFSVPVDHLNALHVIAEHFESRDLSNAVVVSPDLGNAKAATQFARLLGLPVAAGSKRRISDDKVVIDSIVGDVHGKDVIVLDDEIATGGSIMELVDRIDRERVGKISVACTHGIFSGTAIERFAAADRISEIVTTNTVPVPDHKRLPNMTILSIAPLLADAIHNIHEGESVSSLFVHTL